MKKLLYLVLAVVFHMGLILGTALKTENGRKFCCTEGRNVLHCAVLNGNERELKLLSMNKALINQFDDHGAAPLHYAVTEPESEKKKIEFIQVLLEAGANVNIKSYLDFTPLHAAAFYGYRMAAQVLIAYGANMYATNSAGRTSLHLAAHRGHSDVIKLLIACEMDVDVIDNKKWSPLHFAADGGHLEVVKFLVKEDANINAINSDGDTALHLAARRGHIEIVKYLLSNDIDVCAKNKNDKDALAAAKENGHKDIEKTLIQGLIARLGRASAENNIGQVKVLLECCPEIMNAPGCNGRTAFQVASSNGYQNLAKFLIDRGAIVCKDIGPMEVDKKEDEVCKFSTFDEAEEKGKKRKKHKTKKKEKNGEEGFVNEDKGGVAGKDVRAETLTVDDMSLHEAVVTGDVEAVIQFLHNKKTIKEIEEAVNQKNEDSRTPLLLAIENGNADLIKFLILNGANDLEAGFNFINHKVKYLSSKENGILEAQQFLKDYRQYCYDQSTVTMPNNMLEKLRLDSFSTAAKKGNLKMVGYWLRFFGHKAITAEGETALHLAAHRGQLVVAQFLLDNGACIEAKNKKGSTPLLMAAENGHKDMVSFLVEKGANVNAKDNNGNIALLFAVENTDIEMAQCLINAKAYVNAANNQGVTALYLAAKKGQREIVEYLIRRDANANTADNWGCTPLLVAVASGHLNVVEFLVKNRKANINAANNDGVTAVHMAGAKWRADMVKLLVEEGNANITVTNNLGDTVLHFAALGEYCNKNASEQAAYSTIEALLGYGVNVNVTNEGGCTPLHFAASKGNEIAVKCLIVHGADKDKINNKRKTPLDFAIASKDRGILGARAVVDYLIGLSKPKVFHGTCSSGAATSIEPQKLDLSDQLMATGQQKGNRYRMAAVLKTDHSAPTESCIINRKFGGALLINEKKEEVRLASCVTGLHRAVVAGNIHEVKQLLRKKKVDVDAKDERGLTALHVALIQPKPSIDMIKCLAKEGNANINSVNNDGETALHFAASQDLQDIVKFLVTKGADVNVKNKRGASALVAAANCGRLEVVKFLVENVKTLDQDDIVKAVAAAEEREYQNIVDYLDGKTNIVERSTI